MLRAASGRLRRPGEALGALSVVGSVLGVSAFAHRATAAQKTDACRHTYRAQCRYPNRYLFRRYTSSTSSLKRFDRLPRNENRIPWWHQQANTPK